MKNAVACAVHFSQKWGLQNVMHKLFSHLIPKITFNASFPTNTWIVNLKYVYKKIFGIYILQQKLTLQTKQILTK